MYSVIIYRKRLFIQMMVYTVFFGTLGILSLYLLQSRLVDTILVSCLLLPLPLLPLIMKLFTKRVLISMDASSLTVEKIHKYGFNDVAKFYLSNIKSYCISFPNERFSAIKFKLKNGGHLEYSFYQKKKHADDIDTGELIKSFQLAIKNYNNSTPVTHRIIFTAAFYATNAGLFCIVFLCAFFVFAVIFIGAYKQQTLPVTLVGSLMLILQVITKRNNDLKYFKNNQ